MKMNSKTPEQGNKWKWNYRLVNFFRNWIPKVFNGLSLSKNGNVRFTLCLIKHDLHLNVYNFENCLFSTMVSLQKGLAHFYILQENT